MIFNLRCSPFTCWLFLILVALAPLVLAPAAIASEGSDAPPPPAPHATVAAPGPPAKPMVVARLRSKGACGDNCPEWISAQGLITPSTPERFRRQLALMGKAKLPVVIDSEGGDLEAALAIGRMLRAQGLTVVVGSSEVLGCEPRDAACSKGRPEAQPYLGLAQSPGRCAGACLFVLAGGFRRAGSWASPAQLSPPEDFTTRTSGGDATGLVGAYLADMSISGGLLARLRRSSLPLDSSELMHFGLTTLDAGAEKFTAPGICLGPAPAPNCIRTAPAMPARPAVQAAPRSTAKTAARPAPPAAAHRIKRAPGRVIILGGIEN